MKKNLVSLLVAGFVLLGIAGTAFAGVGPSPFQPQINKINSIQLSMAFIQKNIGNLAVSKTLSLVSRVVMSGIKYNLSDLDGQLVEVMAELPPYSELGDSQKGVYYALEGVRLIARGMENPLDYIIERMGIESSPFKKSLDSMTTRIGDYTEVCTPGTVCQ